MTFIRCTLRECSSRPERIRLSQCWLGALVLSCLVLSASPVIGAAPPNDTCGGAEVVSRSGPFPWSSTIIADVTYATTTGETVEPSCLPFVSRSVWFVFNPAETAFYRLSVSGDTATTVRDTVMAIYTSAGGCAGSFTEVDCNDDAGLTEPHLLKSAIARVLDAGTTYYIVVWVLGDYPPDPGFTAVQLRVSKPRLPQNDVCSGAELIPGSGPFPYLTAVTDTLLAVRDPSEPIPTCRIRPYSERSVWYRFTPEQSAFYSISTIGGPGGTATTIYDTTLAAYTSSNGCAGPFVPFACNDDIAPGREFRSEIKTNFSAGTTYYITVCDTEPEPAVTETDVQLRVTIPPEAITLPASSVTSVGAVVNGLVRLNGLRTFFWFEWGTNTTSNITYNLPRSALKLLFPPATEVNTNATFAGILPNVLYHYRLVATNTNGRAEGDDRTFLWSTASPTLQAYTIPVTGGSFQFEFNGSPGQLYRAQSSTNLADWVDLGSATEVGPVGQGTNRFRFIDLRLPVPPSRFYRIWAP